MVDRATVERFVSPHAILVLAPHFDDAVFSLGGLLQQICDQIVVATVFSRSNWTRDGISVGREEEISALRQAEDRDALGLLGVRERRTMGHPEAPLRGYAFREIFDGRTLDLDPIRPELERDLDELVLQLRPSVVLAPLGLGRHVDHRLVSYVAQAKLRSVVPVMFYEDLPYAIRASEDLILRRAAGRAPWPIALTEVQLSAKVAALAYYRSQVSSEDIEAVVMHARRRGSCEERLYGDEPGTLLRRASESVP